MVLVAAATLLACDENGGPTSPTPNAIIRGTALDFQTGAPVSAAVVRVTLDSQGSGGTEAVTDASGHYFIVLNGALGIGKSTLAEALTERLDRCVMLDGDRLVAANPPPADALEHLHSTIALLVAHHRRFGYRHFVIDHIWRSAAELADLRRRLAGIDGDADVRCFLLTLPADENLRRIERRQAARAIDEREFELRTFAEERTVLTSGPDLGEPFDVSAPPAELVKMMLRRLALG